MKQTKYKIVFSGGGTLGPVIPLLAVWEEIKKNSPVEIEAIWIGTTNGPERRIVEKAGIKFIALGAPKFRRYFTLKNLFVPFRLVWSFFKAFKLLGKIHPKVIVSAGGYTSIPVHYAGWLLRISSFVHQQDVGVSLTNKLIAPLASSISCAFESSCKEFKKKTICIGNPVAENILRGSKERAKEIFELEDGVPVVLILGGGTGAKEINNAVWNGLPELVQFCQVIHGTGAGKCRQMKTQRYHQYPFISHEDLAHAYAATDLVVVRAGMGTITEITALSKPAILVPILNSDQEKNAEVFEKAGAVVVFRSGGKANLISQIKNLLQSGDAQKMSANLKKVMRTDGATRLGQMILYALSRK